ncbi:MAG: hypothetical protein RQ731_08145, partial [Anaerosomatales bacterium]|nr:hypothetical protein [Anaerosomatales bacterium]
MEAVLKNERVRTAARATTKAIALTVTFAALYYFMNSLNPAVAKSIGEPFGLTFRFAQVLRAFTLWLGPVVPVGTFVGSKMFNSSVGDAFSFVPVFNMFIGIGIWRVSKLIGRSTRKDLALVLAYGLLTGLVVSLKLSGWAL